MPSPFDTRTIAQLRAESPAAPLTGAELLELVQGGLSVGGTVQQLFDWFNLSSGTNETIDDRVAALLTAGSGITLTYNDVANTLTLSTVPASIDEAVDDRVAALLTAGTGITLTYNDVANTLTITNPPVSIDETVDDRVAALLTAGTGVTLVYNDVANTLTISSPPVSIDEAVDDRVAALLTAGTNITLVYNDVANTLTISSSGTPVYTPPFSTLDTALAQAPAGISGMEVTGRRVSADGGHGLLAVYPSAGSLPAGIPASSVFTLADTVRKARWIEKSLRLEHFDGRANDVTYDNKQAFIDMIKEWEWRGGGRIDLKEGATYRMQNTAHPAGNYVIYEVNNLRGGIFNHNGARIDWQSTFSDPVTSGAVFIQLLRVKNCVDTRVWLPEITQTNDTGLSAGLDRGMCPLGIGMGCHGIDAETKLTSGGWAGVVIGWGAEGDQVRANQPTNIKIKTKVKNSVYGIAQSGMGIDLEANIYTDKCYRSWLADRPQRARVWVDSTAMRPGSDDVVIGVNANAALSIAENSATDIELHYRCKASSDLNGVSGYILIASGGTPVNVPVLLSGIKVRLDIDSTGRPGTGGVPPRAVRVICVNSHPSPGDSSKAWVIDGVTVTGYCDNFVSGSIIEVSSHIQNAPIRNVTLGGDEGLTLKSTGVTQAIINASYMDGAFTCKNLVGNNTDLVGINFPSDLVDFSQGVRLRNIKSVDFGVGYRCLPAGLFEQWGTVATNGAAINGVPYPKAFRTGSIVRFQADPATDGYADPYNTRHNNDTSGVIYRGVAGGSINFNWRALGQFPGSY